MNGFTLAMAIVAIAICCQSVNGAPSRVKRDDQSDEFVLSPVGAVVSIFWD